MTDFSPIERGDWIAAPDGLVRIPGGSVTSPDGYVAYGATCGLKVSGARDIGVLRSLRPTRSWLMDTTNALPSAPVRVNRTRDRSQFSAVVVNAGIANAATGDQGERDALAMAEQTGLLLGVAPETVLVSSTGVIGEHIDMDKIGRGIIAATDGLSVDGGTSFNEAICTTDRTLKGGAFVLQLPEGDIRIGIAAKGAGMIRPTMATMLAYVTTDAPLSADDVREITLAAGESSFNRISVDGQMSPSDTLLVMANGAGAPLAGASRQVCGDAIAAVCRWAAIQMAKDGEGAAHTVRLGVHGALDRDEAARVARGVAESPLVKTAIFGRDPNWGRISQAVGQALAVAAGQVFEPVVVIDGVAIADAATVMDRAEYDIEIGLSRGNAEYALWVSDLTHDYVTLNAEYHT